MNKKIRIYLRDSVYPIELEGTGIDKRGLWAVTITFKDNYVWVRREWNSKDVYQVLYTIPKFNLYYVDWGNDLKDEHKAERRTSKHETCFA